MSQAVTYGPPRPRLTLRIGITGHRLDGVRLTDAQMPLLEQAIDAILSGIKRTLGVVLHENTDVFEEAAPQLRLISPVAEGADQAAARAALSHGLSLECPLPFARSAYEEDFAPGAAREELRRLLSRANAVLELPGDRTDPDAAYETVGLIMLGQSDLVIAVWDGDLKEQRRGGSAEMVTRAIELGIPVLWLKPGATSPLLIDRGSAGGSRWDLVAMAAPIGPGGLEALVRRLAEPPRNLPVDEDAPSLPAHDRLRGFLREQEKPLPWWPFAYRLMLGLLTPKAKTPAKAPPSFLAAGRESWTERLQPLRRLGPAVMDGFERILVPRFAWADGLSTQLGHIYRSGYVMNFAGAAAAVFFALLGLVWLKDAKPVWVAIELVLIGGVFKLTQIGTAWRWHDRWVDYRQLAERLRHLRFAAITGSRNADARVPHFESETRPGPAWVNWYFRATLREIPLADGRIDADYIQALRQLLATEIEEQRAYHKRNGERLHALYEALDHAGQLLFAVTAGLCVAFIMGAMVNVFVHPFSVETKEQAREWVSFLCGVLPAAGAAAFGIRVQGDFKAASERSVTAARILEQLGADLAKEAAPAFSRLSAISDEVASVMITELSDWSFVYREKPLALPG